MTYNDVHASLLPYYISYGRKKVLMNKLQALRVGTSHSNLKNPQHMADDIQWPVLQKYFYDRK